MVKMIVFMLAVALVACNGKDGRSGQDGQNGLNGHTSPPAVNGHSAAFAAAPADVSLCAAGGTVLNAGTDFNDDGALELTEVSATAVVCNGAPAATNGFEPTNLVAACGGNIADSNNELFIRLANGILIGSVSQNVNGLNTHFGVVAPGTWVSTGSNGHTCVFTVDESYNITVL